MEQIKIKHVQSLSERRKISCIKAPINIFHIPLRYFTYGADTVQLGF